jgi:hypothetical protein
MMYSFDHILTITNYAYSFVSCIYKYIAYEKKRKCKLISKEKRQKF